MKQTKSFSPSAESVATGATPLGEALAEARRRIASARDWASELQQRLVDLDAQNRHLTLDASELGSKTIVLVVVAGIVMGIDTQVLSAFAQSYGELLAGAVGRGRGLALEISAVLVACDAAAGLLFTSAGSMRTAAVWKQIVVGSLLLVPTSITLATAVARWQPPNAPMPIEGQLLTFAVTVLSLAVHAALIGLASGGVMQWVRYVVKRWKTTLQVRRAKGAEADAELNLDRAEIRVELGMNSETNKRIRETLQKTEPDTGRAGSPNDSAGGNAEEPQGRRTGVDRQVDMWPAQEPAV